MLEPGERGSMIPRNAKYKRFDEEKGRIIFPTMHGNIYIYIIYIRDVRLKKDRKDWKILVSLVKSFYTFSRGQCANRLLDRASSKAITIDTRSTRKKKKKKEREIYQLKATNFR